MTLEASRYRQRRGGVHAVALEGGTLIWESDAEVLHRLNTSAAFVWNECEHGASIDQIVAAAVARHGEPPALRADVERCIRELVEAGLLEAEPDRSS